METFTLFKRGFMLRVLSIIPHKGKDLLMYTYIMCSCLVFLVLSQSIVWCRVELRRREQTLTRRHMV